MKTNSNTQPVTELAGRELASSVVGVFDTHAQAERAVEELEKAGFDMRRIAILDDKHVVIAHDVPRDTRNATAKAERPVTGAARVAQHVSIS